MLLKRWAWAFTIIEFSIVLAVIGIMATLVMVSFKNVEEDTDKVSLEAGLSTFQNVLLEGSQRSERSPKDIDMRSILATLDPKPAYADYAEDRNAYNIAVSGLVAGVGTSTQYQWTYIDDPSDPAVTLATKPNQIANWTDSRTITFRVNDCGTVCPVELSGFDHYELKPNINTVCPADPVEKDCNVILKKP